MQVDPINPTLKAAGSILSKLRYVGPVSNFAFKFNLRRYNLVLDECLEFLRDPEAGAYTLSISAQLEITLPLSAQLKHTSSPI